MKKRWKLLVLIMVWCALFSFAVRAETGGAAQLGQQLQALVVGEAGLDIEPEETFGTRALGLILTSFHVLKKQGETFVANFTALPDAMAWIERQMNDPATMERWSQIGASLLLVVGLAFVFGWVAEFLLLPFRRRISKNLAPAFGARFLLMLGWFGLALLPVAIFLGAALVLLNQSDPSKLARFIVMTVVYAAVVLRLVRLVARFLLAPRVPSLRLVPVNTAEAKSIVRWIGSLGAIMVIGFFGVDVARAVKMPATAISVFSALVEMAIVVMAIILIVQKRALVSEAFRGNLSVAQHGLTLWQGLRLWLARSWHVLAITYLVVGYTVAVMGSGGGFAAMQSGTVLTLLVLLVVRFVFHGVARLDARLRAKGEIAASGLYRPVLKGLLQLGTLTLGCAGITAAWGVDVGAFVGSPWGQRILGSAFSITMTIVLVVMVYEALHVLIERHLNRRDHEGHAVEINARARTLLPMARIAALIVLTIVVGMVTLSELGVNIAPLLAGAGVIGVAVGFGSQTLIKDFLTGLFIILEDSIAMGDTVKVGDHEGKIESITLRTVRLRDIEGDLHILPFSEITKIVNKTKNFSYALVDLNVAYESDLSKVMRVMKESSLVLRQDVEVGALILEPMEVLGVENLADSAITVRGRIKTAPGKKMEVKRAYLLKVKQAFDAANIKIPYPTSVQLREGAEK